LDACLLRFGPFEAFCLLHASTIFVCVSNLSFFVLIFGLSAVASTMPRKVGSKDLRPRVNARRDSYTGAERRAFQDWAGVVQVVPLQPVPPQPVVEEQAPVVLVLPQQEAPQNIAVDVANVPTTPESVEEMTGAPLGIEPDVAYIVGPNANGTIDPAPIVAALEGAEEGSVAAGPGSGIVLKLLEKIQARLSLELRSGTMAVDKWLTRYLENHNFWLSRHGLPMIANRLALRVRGADEFYLRDVKVWLPDVQFDKKSDRPCCPSCGTNSRVYPN
jgi:hypothetical protein